jgi:hypothetical protein
VQPKDLVLVAGHAAFKKEVAEGPARPESGEPWVLQPFQIGEAPFYVEHIRRGVVLTVNNPLALLVFSGGRTREEAGTWSEAKTYCEIARQAKWWVPEEKSQLRDVIAGRATTEEYARDSFENLLFGICRFQQVTGDYPRIVTIVSWGFKRTRFELHRAATCLPPSRFRFDGFNDPLDLAGAWNGEKKALYSFIEYRYGSAGELKNKRRKRNPYNQEHPYRACPGLGEFFKFLDNEENAKREYPDRLPWED